MPIWRSFDELPAETCFFLILTSTWTISSINGFFQWSHSSNGIGATVPSDTFTHLCHGSTTSNKLNAHISKNTITTIETTSAIVLHNHLIEICVEWFRQYDEITRGEASKFITQYAKVLNLSPNYTECTFSDIATYDYTLTPFIAEVCSYGLIKGSNGKYMPEWKLTEAQAATIIVRSLEGFKDETKEPWYIDYYTRAQELGLISNETVAWVNNTNITRGKLWTWLFLAYAGKSIPDSSDPDAAIGVSMNLTDSNGNKTDISGKMAVDIERQERVQWLIEYDAEKVNLAVAQGQQVVLNFAATRCPLCNALEADLDENELFRNVKKEVTLVEIIEEITTN